MKPTNSTTEHDLKKSILEKIDSNEIRMRPRSFFTLQFAALLFVGICLLVTVALLTSFILFSLRMSDRLFLIDFGARGIKMFLFLFPWKLLLETIVLLVLFIVLLRQYRFAYRAPVIYFSCGALVLSIVAGSCINITSLHTHLMQNAQNKQLPLIATIYEHVRRPSETKDIARGKIIEMDLPRIIIRNEEQEDIIIRLPPNQSRNDYFAIGDWVFVAGDIENGELRAYGIRKSDHN